MKFKIFLFTILVGIFQSQLAMNNQDYNSQSVINTHVPHHEYSTQEKRAYQFISYDPAAPVSKKTRKKRTFDNPVKKIIQPTNTIDWASFWDEANKHINNNNADTQNETLESNTTQVFPAEQRVSINALLDNPKPNQKTRTNYERSPATEFLRKKTFSILCCKSTITNFDALKKHIKEEHQNSNGLYDTRYKDHNHTYTTVALAASKVASLAVPGFFDCPYKNCAFKLTSAQSLTKHFKIMHGNKKINHA